MQEQNKWRNRGKFDGFGFQFELTPVLCFLALEQPFEDKGISGECRDCTTPVDSDA